MTGQPVAIPVPPRETMRGQPRIVQPFLTWVTGVPLAGTRPRVRWRPGLAAIAGVVQTALGIAAGALVLSCHRIVLLPLVVLAWPVIAGGMRRLDVVVVHQAMHGMFTASATGNRVVSEIITTLLWRPPYDTNKREHLLHHAYPCSMRDADTGYLLSTSVRPRMTRREFRRYLVGALVSPRHHWSFFSSRIKGNYFSRLKAYRLVMSVAYLAATLALLVMTGWWLQWLLLWFIPVTFFFQNQTLLYTLSEHRWWLFGNAERLTRAQRDQLTFGRFCGRPVPECQRDGAAGPHRAAAELRHALRMAAWWAHMVLVYAPYRLCILVGDTVQHDLHHLRPRCDWANSSWERNNELAGDRADRFYEAWGGLLTHVYVGNSVLDFSAQPSVPLARAVVSAR
jgi:fatty acid desaturase